MARPERFELPTYSSGGCRSIQLSYGRVILVYIGTERGVAVAEGEETHKVRKAQNQRPEPTRANLERATRMRDGAKLANIPVSVQFSDVCCRRDLRDRRRVLLRRVQSSDELR